MPKKTKTKKKSKKSRSLRQKNEGPCWILVIASIFMILDRVSNGPGIIGFIGIFLVNWNIVTDPWLVFFVQLTVLIFVILGWFGGFTVLFGTYLIYYQERIFIGKFVVGIGSGLGLLSFIILLIFVLFGGFIVVFDFIWFVTHSLGVLGIFLILYGRMKVQKA